MFVKEGPVDKQRSNDNFAQTSTTFKKCLYAEYLNEPVASSTISAKLNNIIPCSLGPTRLENKYRNMGKDRKDRQLNNGAEKDIRIIGNS